MGKGKVIVIGAGASGLMAGIMARRMGSDVLVLDGNTSFGKKILKTGGGRCNFSNQDTKLTHFHTESKDAVKSVLSSFTPEMLINFMSEIGITNKSIDGWIYPHSLQAKSVRDCLLMEAEINGVKFMSEAKVNGIKKDGKRFVLDTKAGVLNADGIILATGGMADPESGSDGNGFVLAKELGHEIVKPLPALCPLNCEDRFLKRASGIRCDVNLTMRYENESAKEAGNLQITDYGISGICTMQLSRLASKALYEKKEVFVDIDFVPELKINELKKELVNRYHTHGRGKGAGDALLGLIPDKLITCILVRCNLDPKIPAVNLPKEKLDEIAEVLKGYTIKITDTRGFNQAQTTLGGVSFKDIDKKTLISKLHENLGFCGEILDVCGDCGGYNLLWAFASGAVAGNSILGGKK